MTVAGRPGASAGLVGVAGPAPGGRTPGVPARGGVGLGQGVGDAVEVGRRVAVGRGVAVMSAMSGEMGSTSSSTAGGRGARNGAVVEAGGASGRRWRASRLAAPSRYSALAASTRVSSTPSSTRCGSVRSS